MRQSSTSTLPALSTTAAAGNNNVFSADKKEAFGFITVIHTIDVPWEGFYTNLMLEIHFGTIVPPKIYQPILKKTLIS